MCYIPLIRVIFFKIFYGVTTQMTMPPKTLYTEFFNALSAQKIEEANALIQQLQQDHGDWAKTHSAAGAFALFQKHYPEAEQHFARAVALEPNHGEYLFNWVQLLLKADKVLQAQQVLLPLHPEQVKPKDADTCFLFARVLVSTDFSAAFQWIQAALSFFPRPESWADAAAKCFEIAPDLLQALIEDPAAQEKSASAQRSVWVQMYVFLALEQQNFERARPYLVQALSYNRELAVIAYRATEHLYKQKAYDCMNHYFAACEPFLAELPVPSHLFYRAWALGLWRTHDYDQANRYYDKAIQSAPHPLTYAFEKISHFPAVYESETDIQVYRQQFAYQLNKLEQQADRCIQQKNIPRVMHMRYPFQLTYQGLNDKDLVSQLGRVAHRLFYGTSTLQKAPYLPSQKLPIKVGFVSTYFFNHSVMNAYGKGIVHLAKDTDIDVHVLHLGETYDDKSAWMAEHVQHFKHEPRVSQAIECLKTWQVDVLIYTDIGMAPETYVMALQRLAPIQGVLGGHPVTTGIPHMDYFFRADRKEQQHPEQYYSEKLVLLEHGIGKPNYYTRPENYTRDMFTAATPEHHVYFCPMTLIKIHPSFDKALQAILARDPQGQIYFVDNPEEPEIGNRLRQRFEKNLGAELAQRIHFIPWLVKETFFEALCAADVILDSFGFGSGTTTYQVLSMHQPMVTLPGELYRNSITAAYYRRFGLEALVAESLDDYVNKALRIASDQAYREGLQVLIAEQVAAYPERKDNAMSFKDSLIYLAQNHGKMDPQQRVFRF